jgi:hypothetical protein
MPRVCQGAGQRPNAYLLLSQVHQCLSANQNSRNCVHLSVLVCFGVGGGGGDVVCVGCTCAPGGWRAAEVPWDSRMGCGFKSKSSSLESPLCCLCFFTFMPHLATVRQGRRGARPGVTDGSMATWRTLRESSLLGAGQCCHSCHTSALCQEAFMENGPPLSSSLRSGGLCAKVTQP